MGLFNGLGKLIGRAGLSIIHLANGDDVYAVKGDTLGRIMSRGEDAVIVSGAVNAAGSATFSAATAGVRRTISDIIINTKSTAPALLFVGGAKKLFPRFNPAASSTVQVSPNSFVQASANVALKVSAIGAGSATFQVHYLP